MLGFRMLFQTQLIISDPTENIKELNSVIPQQFTELLTITNSPDLNVLSSEEQNIGIDEIRPLLEWLPLKPFNNNVKLALILGAEKLTIEAQNILLKSLEEPPADTQICLVTNSLHAMLPTITSRCIITDISTDKKQDAAATTQLAQEFLAGSYIDRLEFIKQKILANNTGIVHQQRIIADIIRQLIKKEQEKVISLDTIELCKLAYIGLSRNANQKLTWETLAITIDK